MVHRDWHCNFHCDGEMHRYDCCDLMPEESDPFETYLEAVGQDLADGLATEHTYRPHLKRLMEGIRPGITATNEPRRVECGAPDYVVTRRSGHGPLTIGHIEAKDVGRDLREEQETEQLKRYRTALPNLVLTDYLEFRWFVDGELRLQPARLARLESGSLVLDSDGLRDVREMLLAFLDRPTGRIRSPRTLAERMARLTHLIRDIIVNALESESPTRTLADLLTAFRQVLLPELPVPEFADMYAQTLAYGLFAARVSHESTEEFTRELAGREIPRTNPFLRRLFATITGPDFDDEPYSGLVDDLAQLLSMADMPAILAHFGTETRRQDPVVHFYETFLTAYDPALRELRGVYYTPEPVVSYITRSVDSLLRSEFGLADGIGNTETLPGKDGEAQPKVLVLDPALGTGTFLYAITDQLREALRASGNAGTWRGFVREQLLPRLHGFELLMAPYAIAHLKLSLQLAGLDLAEEERADWAYTFAEEERLNIFLTNALEEAVVSSELLFGEFISDEANAAADVKREKPIMVVLGNPPYSGHSANKGTWITDLVHDYKRHIPGLDRPAQAKWLQDDYAKFIRFGEWRIARTGAGILAFITNHAYLDNTTFRGMRKHLMETFSEIYVLDLHGSKMKRERLPEGVHKDDNVFDIRQGVAIALFVKRPGGEGQATVRHSELWDKRAPKYKWLSEHDVSTTEWQTLAPSEPFYLFTPTEEELRAEYERGWPLPAVMDQNGTPAPGIVTMHDEFAVSWTRLEASEKVRAFLRTTSEADARRLWKLSEQAEKEQWAYDSAKKKLSAAGWRKDLTEILYRPFDQRWTVFNAAVAVHRRLRVMKHMVNLDNLALAVGRAGQVVDAWNWDLVFCSTKVTDFNLFRRGGHYLFPLYLLNTSEPGEQLVLEEAPHHEGSEELRVNLNPGFLEALEASLGLRFINGGKGDLEETVGAEDVFHYIYALLHSPTYRTRYQEFLRVDFPRIPLASRDIFRDLAAHGEELVGLHTGRITPAAQDSVTYPLRGDDIIAKGFPQYLPPGSPDPLTRDPLSKGRVYISRWHIPKRHPGQYFEGVSPEVWHLTIGGYGVCQKWVKDRRGRVMSNADISAYRRLCGAVVRTIELMDEIDAAAGTWPIDG